MKQHPLSFLLLIGVFACQHRQTDAAKAPADLLASEASLIQSASDITASTPVSFLVIPGKQVGPVNAAATEASLISLLGAGNVRRDTIYIAEGNFDIGTTLYKNTPDQAQILWTNNRRFADPKSVLLRPARDEFNNLLPGAAPKWVTTHGLKIGTSLRAVEKVNGRAFALYGFEWDYGGSSAGWKGGMLEQKDGKSFISLRFGVPESLPASQERLYESLMGDREFLSSNPAMQKLNPTVQTLTISFK